MKRQGKRKAPAELPQYIGMSIEDTMIQLSMLEAYAIGSMEEDKDPEWQEKIDACKSAVAFLTALQFEGIKDPEQARDLIHDYNALAEQYQKMCQHYEKPEKPIQLGVAYICPNCKKQLRQTNAGHCWACGKRLNWFLH